MFCSPSKLLRSRRAANRGTSGRHTQFESLEIREMMAADFLSASLVDASGDITEATVFADGALRVGYDLKTSNRDAIESIGVLATNSRSAFELKSSNTLMPTGGLPSTATDLLFDLKDFPKLTAGEYNMQIVAHFASGDASYSRAFDMRILNTTQVDGSFQGEWFDLGSDLSNTNRGIVVHGQGGTDTMYLSKAISQIASINGQSLTRFNPQATDKLPIYQGYAVDHIVLNNGNEIYFTGIERLEGSSSSRFAGNTVIDLSVAPNDPEFKDQWNLHVSDVPSAWRFTTGSEDVLLVSLDTGVLPESTPEEVYGHVADLSSDRLITDPTDVEDHHFLDAKFGHGHMSLSVMSSTPNNGSFVAGINWTSDVLVADVYDTTVTLQAAIQEALSYAAQHGQKVVFQGGIQGEAWLHSGGTQAQLETILSASETTAVYAVAAGNGGVEVDAIPEPNQDHKKSGGVARLQGTHDNVLAIGALQRTESTVAGLSNASDVFRADYSNYGSGVTVMGATDSPATYQFSGIEDPQFNQSNTTRIFTGTSAANPNVAGIASLVWSMNVDLTGNDIRTILTDTAMANLPDFEPNIFTGKDFDYGHGLVNADLAVRRAMALATDEALVHIDEDPRTQLFEPAHLDYSPSIGSLNLTTRLSMARPDTRTSFQFTSPKADLLVEPTAETSPVEMTSASQKMTAASQSSAGRDQVTAKPSRSSTGADAAFASIGHNNSLNKSISSLRYGGLLM